MVRYPVTMALVHPRAHVPHNRRTIIGGWMPVVSQIIGNAFRQNCGLSYHLSWQQVGTHSSPRVHGLPPSRRQDLGQGSVA
jgi:hypothetical protein